jgi:hypothetical protein
MNDVFGILSTTNDTDEKETIEQFAKIFGSMSLQEQLACGFIFGSAAVPGLLLGVKL